MVHDPMLECSFLIPLRRDAILSDGEVHQPALWEWLYDELFERFHGATQAPGTYHGFYKDPDSGERVVDESIKVIVVVQESQLDQLRGLLVGFTVFFQQKCIYLNVAGRVEFVEFPDDSF